MDKMENINKAQVVGYLRFLANNTGVGKIAGPEDEWSQENGLGRAAYQLLKAGLLAAATQIEAGRIDDIERHDYRHEGVRY